MSLTFINANYSCSVYCLLCMCMDLRSLQLFCLIIWEFSKIHCFVCKCSSLIKVGKIFPSHFVVSLNKCLEVGPCHLDWSWFEGLLHKVLNLINIPLSRSMASMAWDVWGFRVVSFRWDFKSWFVWVNSKDGPMGISWRMQYQTWLLQKGFSCCILNWRALISDPKEGSVFFLFFLEMRSFFQFVWKSLSDFTFFLIEIAMTVVTWVSRVHGQLPITSN